MSNILVIAAHPDDEILGVGGTVAKHVDDGDIVYALILGEGQTSRKVCRDLTSQETILSLHEDSLRAAKVVGYQEVFFENLPDNRFDQVDLLDIVKKVEYYISKLQPRIVYTHHRGDLNIDHQYTFQSVLTATRPLEDNPVKEIYCFETVSSTEWNFSYGNNVFIPNMFVNVTNMLDKKKKAMQMYKSELCAPPHPRSIENLEICAKRWGSIVGKEYVEAFEMIRRIKD